METIRNIVISASLLAAAVGLAPAAHAYYCESGYTCTFRDANFTGGQVDFQYYIPDFSEYSFEGTYVSANDRISSAINNGRSYTSCLYENAGGRGRELKMKLGYRHWNLKYANPAFNDTASSGYFHTFMPKCG